MKKIYVPMLHNNSYINLIVDLIRQAGLEVVHTFDNPVDFVFFGLNFPNIYENVPEQYKANSGIQLTDKEVLHDTIAAAGLNQLESKIIVDEQSISTFQSSSVIVKPLRGAGSMTPYTFVYKTFTSKTDLINTINQEAPDFFTVNEDGSSICSTHVIQQAILAAEDGYVPQYYVPVYVNGQGEIVSEGIGKNNQRFNELNDVDDTVYPLRHMRDYMNRNTEDQSDPYNILDQLRQLIDYCQIKNTPIHSQWLIDSDGNPCLIDISFQFQRASMLVPGLRSTELIIDKIQYVYDIKPNIEIPSTGWVGLADFIITSDKASTVEYAASVGLMAVTTWPLVSKAACLSMPFSFTGATEQECLDKIELVRTYIANNPIE